MRFMEHGLCRWRNVSQILRLGQYCSFRPLTNSIPRRFMLPIIASGKKGWLSQTRNQPERPTSYNFRQNRISIKYRIFTKNLIKLFENSRLTIWRNTAKNKTKIWSCRHRYQKNFIKHVIVWSIRKITGSQLTSKRMLWRYQNEKRRVDKCTQNFLNGNRWRQILNWGPFKYVEVRNKLGLKLDVWLMK